MPPSSPVCVMSLLAPTPNLYLKPCRLVSSSDNSHCLVLAYRSRQFFIAMNKQDASSIEMDLRLRVLTAMLAVLWVHSGEVQEPALKTLQILFCDASLLEKSLDKDVVGVILTSLQELHCSHLGLELLHTMLCGREDISEHLIDRIRKQVAFFRGRELIQQCMAAHPAHAEIQNIGEKCLNACAQWFEKVQSQSAEVEKLAYEGLKFQLDLASLGRKAEEEAKRKVRANLAAEEEAKRKARSEVGLPPNASDAELAKRREEEAKRKAVEEVCYLCDAAFVFV